MIFISNKIEVKKSQIEGRGVFAKEDIKSNEVIEISHFTTLKQPFSQIDDKLKEYVFSWPKNVWGGKSVIVWGFASIYNHSDNNNVDWVTDEENNLFKFFTIKDIKKGEEICSDYGEAYKKVVKTIK